MLTPSEIGTHVQHGLRLTWYTPTLVWKQTQMRVHLPMTIQALPGAIGPLPNVPFSPSDYWSESRLLPRMTNMRTGHIYLSDCSLLADQVSRFRLCRKGFNASRSIVLFVGQRWLCVFYAQISNQYLSEGETTRQHEYVQGARFFSAKATNLCSLTQDSTKEMSALSWRKQAWGLWKDLCPYMITPHPMQITRIRAARIPQRLVSRTSWLWWVGCCHFWTTSCAKKFRGWVRKYKIVVIRNGCML